MKLSSIFISLSEIVPRNEHHFHKNAEYQKSHSVEWESFPHPCQRHNRNILPDHISRTSKHSGAQNLNQESPTNRYSYIFCNPCPDTDKTHQPRRWVQ